MKVMTATIERWLSSEKETDYVIPDDLLGYMKSSETLENGEILTLTYFMQLKVGTIASIITERDSFN